MHGRWAFERLNTAVRTHSDIGGVVDDEVCGEDGHSESEAGQGLAPVTRQQRVLQGVWGKRSRVRGGL